MSQKILKTCNSFSRINSLNWIWMILLLNSINIWNIDEIKLIIIRIIAVIGGSIELLWCYKLLNVLDNYSLIIEEIKISKILKILYIIQLLQLIIFSIFITLSHLNFLLNYPIIIIFLILSLVPISISIISGKRVKLIKRKEPLHE